MATCSHGILPLKPRIDLTLCVFTLVTFQYFTVIFFTFNPPPLAYLSSEVWQGLGTSGERGIHLLKGFYHSISPLLT